MQTIQMQLSPNQKKFSEFFSAFPEYTKNFEYFKKKLSLTVDFLVKLYTGKSRVT